MTPIPIYWLVIEEGSYLVNNNQFMAGEGTDVNLNKQVLRRNFQSNGNLACPYGSPCVPSGSTCVCGSPVPAPSGTSLSQFIEFYYVSKRLNASTVPSSLYAVSVPSVSPTTYRGIFYPGSPATSFNELLYGAIIQIQTFKQTDANYFYLNTRVAKLFAGRMKLVLQTHNLSFQ